MGDISTYENVLEMFKQINCEGQENTIFVAIKDISKGARANGIIAGQALGGTIGYTIGSIIGETIEKRTSKLNNYLFLLINRTESGIGIIPLRGGSPFSTNADPEKLKPVFEDSVFYNNEELKDITVKNFNFLNTKVQSIIITFSDGKKLNLQANIKEKFLPYQEECFANFMQLYKK